LAQEVLAENPFSGAVIVWRCKRGDRVKILVWDTSGLVLIWKQLQQGSFRWPPIMNGVMKPRQWSSLHCLMASIGRAFRRRRRFRRRPSWCRIRA
jgi:transposase